MDKWQKHWRWLPSSKVTAAGITGAIYTWGVWVLIEYYDVSFNGVELAATQAWIMFLVGWAITEHRPAP